MNYKIKLTLLPSILLILTKNTVSENNMVCDPRPLGSKTPALPPDNRFSLDFGNDEVEYIPGREYTIKLSSIDGTSKFIAFSISLRDDSSINDKKSKKDKDVNLGVLIPSGENTVNKVGCKNIVMESDITPKTSVEARWIAPPKGSKCVTIYALLAIKRDVWYKNDSPLSKRVCEDSRNIDDMPPLLNKDCQACEDARYLITFEGLWSFNTHSHNDMFPLKSQDLVRFSDLVGAAHNINYSIYKFNNVASAGLKMLAEQANTTKLELEIQKQLANNVRTIIKAIGQPKPNMNTSATFRTSPRYHLVSLVTAIVPSPDWFLGVYNLELCDIITKNWAETIKLNLYPMDAGTDGGLTFEASNEESLPPQPISNAKIGTGVSKEKMVPFARLHLKLIRKYTSKLACNPDSSVITSSVETSEESINVETTQNPVSNTEAPVIADPEATEHCPVTAWGPWSPCEGSCTDNTLKGYQSRFRDIIEDKNESQDVSEDCSLADIQDCTEPCTLSTTVTSEEV